MILGTIARKIRAWHRYHEVLDELSALDPRILDDICVRPCEFERIAREAADSVAHDAGDQRGPAPPKSTAVH